MIDMKQYEIWLANLNPSKGYEPGKVRPVVIIQSNLLNNIGHNTTIVCVVSSLVDKESQNLRVFLDKNITKLDKNSDILVDQIRSIDNIRLIEKIGNLHQKQIELLKRNIRIVLDS